MEQILSLCQGFKENLIIFTLTLIMALPLGLLISLGSMSKFKPIRFLFKAFVWIIRGTPLMLQLFVVLYVPGLIAARFGFEAAHLGRLTSTIIAFVVNYAAYFSEIYRGGIESIPKGQYEAGQVLGLTKVQIFFKIVLMQVIKRIIAPIGNEIMTLAKDTSLARVIGVAEIMLCAERFTKSGLIWPLFSTGLFFLAMCGMITIGLNFTEKKFSYYKG